MDNHERRAQIRMVEQHQIADMFKPVRCWCGRIYDIGAVEVTARYADCSVWQTPCCKRTVDDRGETGWKSIQDYTVLDKTSHQFDADGREW